MCVPTWCCACCGRAAQRWVEMFNCLVAIAFTAGMVWYGWDVVDTALLLDQRSSSDLQFPMWIYYLALPAGGGADAGALRASACFAICSASIRGR